MAVKERSFFKSSDARGFLFFLLLTSVMAVLIKLSKNYSKTYVLPIAIKNVPIDKTVKKISPKEVEITAELSGFSLMRNSFKNPSLDIDFGLLDSVSKTTFTYDTGTLTFNLKQAIIGAHTFLPSRTKKILVDVDVMSGKKVPVKPNIVINYQSGYDAYQNTILDPDSVTVVGPQGVLASIDKVYTKHRTISDVAENVSIDLVLDTLAMYNNVSISNTTFKFEQQVAKYTEGSFLIPITMINGSPAAVKIFPKEVRLYFVASLEEYDSILPSDFEVIADFSSINKGDEFIVLSINKEPSNVRKVRLETKQIKFIVVN